MKSEIFLYQNGKWNKPIKELKKSENSFIFIHGNDENLIKSLLNEYKDHNIIGCTTAGNMIQGTHHEVSEKDSSLTLTHISLNKTKVKIFTEPLINYDNSLQAGKALFNQLNDSPELSGAIVFTEGLFINGAQFAEGINQANNQKIPVIGGLAADAGLFQKTSVFCSEGILLNDAVAIGFYGNDFKMNLSSKSGVEPFGIERRITKSIKNVLYELDKKPALDIYEDFLGDKSAELPASGLHFPVEISQNFEKKEGLVRTPIAINREDKSITFTGEIPQGEYLRLMVASRDSLSLAAEEVAQNCLKDIPKETLESGEYFSFSISCMARKIVLSSDVDDEITPMYEILKSNPNNFLGIYSYGEIITQNDESCLANQTMSQCVIFEV